VVGNRVVCGFMRQSLDDDFRSNTHQGGVGKATRLSSEEEKTAVRAAKAMGLPVCAVDMMRSGRGPLVLEVNSSGSIKTPELLTSPKKSSNTLSKTPSSATAKTASALRTHPKTPFQKRNSSWRV
jgi:ribosomal protein S6--L-glutamate ligase